MKVNKPIGYDAAVITALYGNYDEVKEAPSQSIDVDWVLVTDMPDLPTVYRGWRVVFEPMPGTQNIVAAKRAKCLPWEYTTAPASVWLDASFRVKSPNAIRELIARAHPIAQFAHPDRDCIFAEAVFSLTLDRYQGLPIGRQVSAYQSDGHPANWGLWGAGVIARKHTSGAVRAFGASWLAAIEHWGHQDQISEAPCLREMGLRPVSLPGHLYENEWVAFEPSQEHLEARR